MMKRMLVSLVALTAALTSFTGCDSSSVGDLFSDGSESVETSVVVVGGTTVEEGQTTTTKADTASQQTAGDNATTTAAQDDSASNETETPNAYGYYPQTETLYTSLSMASLAGEWYLADDLFANTLVITATDDLYRATWQYHYEGGGTQTGYAALEYTYSQDCYKEYWYNFYEDDGTLWESFAASGEIPLNDIYAGQSGSPHFVRADGVYGDDSMADGVYGDDSMAGGVYDEGDYFRGTWGCGRASMNVTSGDTAGRYVVTISWASSAFEREIWTYQCYYSQEQGGLVSDFGTRTNEVYSEEGAEPEINTVDGELAAFFLEDGGIRWADYINDMGSDMLFVS